MNKYLLVIQFKRYLATDGLECPVVRFVKLVNFLHLVSLLDKWVIVSWPVVKDCYQELNPVVKSAWLNQKWKQFKSVAHEKDLSDQDQLFEMIWT